MSQLIVGVLLIVTLIELWMAQTTEHWANVLARKIAKRFGWTPMYWDDMATGEWKGLVWAYRYDDIDGMMTRPIHSGMSVAPPWAKRHWVRNEHVKAMLDHKKDKQALLSKFRKPKPPSSTKE